MSLILLQIKLIPPLQQMMEHIQFYCQNQGFWFVSTTAAPTYSKRSITADGIWNVKEMEFTDRFLTPLPMQKGG